MKCFNCQYEQEKDFKHCPECGAKINEKPKDNSADLLNELKALRSDVNDLKKQAEPKSKPKKKGLFGL